MTTPYTPGPWGTIDTSDTGAGAASNLPFHPWIKGYDTGANPNSRNVNLPAVQRGFIRTDPTVYKSADKPTPNRRLHFLYNPGTLETTFGVDGDTGATQYYTRKDGGEQTALSAMEQTITVPLLFDRTYEVSYPNAAGFGGAQIASEGVWRDVRAAMALVGALDESKGDVYQMPPAGFATQAMTQYPCYIHLGSGSQALVFYGIPTGLSVSWTLWSRSMLAVRAGIAISFQLMSRNDIAAPAAPTQGSSGPSVGPSVLGSTGTPLVGTPLLGWPWQGNGLSNYTTGGNRTSPTPSPAPSPPMPGVVNRTPNPAPNPSPTP
ncbi:hypothetical protein ACWDTT_10560 [Streptosporangium sandarakinum]